MQRLIDAGFGDASDPASSAFLNGARRTRRAIGVPAGVPIQRDDDDSWFGGVGNMISSAGSAIASGVGSVVNAGESLASDAVSAVSSGVNSAIDTGSSLLSDAGSAITSEASAAWDAGSKVAGEVGSAISSGAGALADVGSGVESFAEHLPGPLGMPNPLRVMHGLYDVAANGADLGDTLNRTMNPLNYMREDAASIKSGEGLVDRGIDWLEDKGKGATHWLANQVSDIPVVGDIASAGESMVDTGIDFAGGVGKGVTGLAGGLMSMAADPIDTAKGLYTMAEHIPGIGLPEKLLGGAYDLAFTDKSFGQVANETLDPMEDLRYWGRVGSGIVSPIAQSMAAGKPGEAVGQAGVMAAALFGGEGELAAAEEGAELGEGAELAEGAGSGVPREPVPEAPPEAEGVPETADGGGGGGNLEGNGGGGGPGGRSPARIKSETFGKGRPGTPAQQAQGVLDDIQNGKYTPPSDLTEQHLLDYQKTIQDALEKGRPIDKSGVQATRLQIIEELLKGHFRR